MTAPLALSLFASGGIGDLALRAAGAEILVANELLADRAQLYARNFPDTAMLAGDIRAVKAAVMQSLRARLAGRRLNVIVATPPCQGMSKNGRGKLLNSIRAGHKPALDPRNQLIVEVVDFVAAFTPDLLILENVPEMAQTLIADPEGGPDGGLITILDYLQRALPGYAGGHAMVEFANYGIPQRRQRLIAVFARQPAPALRLDLPAQWLPPETHARTPGPGRQPWVSVAAAIGDVPPLDARSAVTAAGSIALHRVPVLDAEKYFWVSNTPPGKSAFDNQCANPACGCQDNPVHGAARVDGVNRARNDTPIRCMACGDLLPRPWVIRDGTHAIMSGFTSAYKRMRGDLPASALTRNMSYACSDQKVHYAQNRVLSIHEALILHTISDYAYDWRRADGVKLSDKTIREVIGESIPPRGLELIFRNLFRLAWAAPAVSAAAE